MAYEYIDFYKVGQAGAQRAHLDRGAAVLRYAPLYYNSIANGLDAALPDVDQLSAEQRAQYLAGYSGSRTTQPWWVLEGRIGDVDPISHGGGFVYADALGNYPPELHYFEPEDDGLRLRLYRVLLENKPSEEWWWESLADVARLCDRSVAELRSDAAGAPMSRARVYEDVAACLGWNDLSGDSYERMFEAEARQRYRVELEALKKS